MMLTRAKLLGAGLLVFGLITPMGAIAQSEPLPAQAQAALYPANMEYVITRNGKKVGSHTLSFSSDANTLSVAVESNIKITVLKVPVYRFNYVSTEQWQDDHLVGVTARTNQGGDVTNVKLDADAAKSVEFSSNHWNAAVLDASSVFNTLTGNVSQVSIESLGSETLSAQDSSITAEHYRYSGDIEADVWYDSQNRWVQLQFKGDDGSDIKYTANPLRMNP